VVILRVDGLDSTAGCHGQGGGPTGGRSGILGSGGPAGGRGCVLAGDRGGGPIGGSAPALAPGKGKQAHVVLDDDEVSSNEDEPLHKRLQRLSGAAGPSGSGPAPTAPDEAAADNRATVTGATEEAMEKAAVDKEATDKSTMDEAIVKGVAVGATGKISFSHSSSSSSVATTMGITASTAGTPVVKAAIRATLGLATGDGP
jgi:hypothetical protein